MYIYRQLFNNYIYIYTPPTIDNCGTSMKAKNVLAHELRGSMKQGKFAESITARMRGKAIILQRKPQPISNTVDQAAWRAKYAACVDTWNGKNEGEQAAYQAAADLRRITAFNQFLSECLATAPPPPDAWLEIGSSVLDSYCGSSYGQTLEPALDGTNYWYHVVDETHWFILDLVDTYVIKKVRGRSKGVGDPTDVNIYIDDSKPPTTLCKEGISTWTNTEEWIEITLDTEGTGRYIKVEIEDTESGNRYIHWGMASNFVTIFDVYGHKV